mgnify:FL=1
MHLYRTHNCSELRTKHVGEIVRISGWVHRKRDHGGLLFLDIRDHFGLTQCVTDMESEIFKAVENLRVESVITVTGKLIQRSDDTINKKIPTGEVEIKIDALEIQSMSEVLPLQVNSDEDSGEEIRLKYRYLDLRRERIHSNIMLRSSVIQSIRKRMIEQGFTEFQTPILTASSPEGARDFLVPARLHPGKFYALPQAPQQFKQLIMVSGFDKYFQIAPCFRDEDSRADRSPGEFYQLDLEMSFVEQEDVFNAVEPVIGGVFEEFTNLNLEKPFPRLTYADSMLYYGTDKPDLRNPIKIVDVTDIFDGSGFSLFAKLISSKNAIVRAIPGPKCGSRSVADRMNSWAQGEGAPGMGYIIYGDGEAKGPVASALGKEKSEEIKIRLGLNDGDAAFFSCSNEKEAADLASKARIKIGIDQGISETTGYKFCWIVDYPMYELDDNGKVEFSHNPFSMPQGGLDALENENPLDIKAWQYDLVCNGVELSSGAIRNHLPEVMYKAFEIAGYSKENVDNNFSGMISAFKFGAPPHGGFAPGIDRIVMLIANEPNIREVILFPMNGKAEDLMMGAPSEIHDDQLKELHIKKSKIIK